MSERLPDPPQLPDARWGTAETSLPDWRDADSTDAEETDEDDITEAPPDVIAMLGFDPFEEEEEEPPVAQDAALAFDRSVRTIDQNGHLHVAMTPISKAVVNEYYGYEIPDADKLGLNPDRRYRLYRDPDEIAKAVGTFNNLPVLLRHQPVSADAHPSNLTVGSTGTDAQFEFPYLLNSLVIWRDDAIEGIENEERKQLSAAYRYRADMTPGTANGERYDGVMRDIAGNHVALVPEGRAGADVVVGDAKPEEIDDMPAAAAVKRLSRQALFLSAATIAYATPKLATDQKMPDLRPLLKGITAKTWKAQRASFETGFAKAMKPRLAQDASMEDFHNFLDGFAQGPAEGELVDEPPTPMEAKEPGTDEEESQGAETPAEELLEFLSSILTPEQMEQARAIATKAATAAGGEGDPPPADPAADPPPPAPEGQDQDPPPPETDTMKKPGGGAEPPITQTAMDAAIKAAVAADRKRANAVHEATEFVRPFIGKIAVAQDSAENVYKLALDTLGIKVEGVHPSAYRTILEMQPKPSEQRRVSPVAMDAAESASFAERYPGVGRLKTI